MELSLSASAHADSRFANNHVGTWSIDSLNIVTGKNTNNNIYSYNGSNGWAVTGTAVNLTKVNPLTVAQVIQASGESIATMSGRDAHLQSSSPLIDQADQSLAPAYDIELKARG
jgi:hypothetical protein